MGPLTIVLLFPLGNFASGIYQVGKPICIQTLVSESSIEAFRRAVLHRLSRLDVNQLYVTLFAPAQEVSAGQLRPVVATNGLRSAALFDDLLQRAGDALAGETRIDFERRALPRASIHDC